MSIEGVPLKYRKTRFMALQRSIVGSLVNRASTPVICARSGLVLSARYPRDPTMVPYWAWRFGSSGFFVSSRERKSKPEQYGDYAGLQLVMLCCCSICLYL